MNILKLTNLIHIFFKGFHISKIDLNQIFLNK